MTCKPKLLFYKELFPYPVQSGTDADTMNLLAVLATAYNVHFVSFDTGHVNEESRRHIEAIVDRLTLIRPFNVRNRIVRLGFAATYRMRAAIMGLPVSALYAQVPPVRRVLRRIVRDDFYDIAAFAYWNAAQLARKMNPKSLTVAYLLDAQFMDTVRLAEMESNPASQRRLLATSERIKRFELASYQGVDRIITLNPVEAELYRTLLPAADIRVVPVVVDTEHFQPTEDGREPVVLFLGNFNHHPNVDTVSYMLEKVWPNVRAEVPHARFQIVGRHGDRVLAHVRHLPGVELLGEVSDLRPLLTRATVFAAPMRTGTGIKIKLLEAMAAGLPVVTTPLGAEALAARNGFEIEIHQNPLALASALVDLLLDPRRARDMGMAARAYIEREHSVASVSDRIIELFASEKTG